jgi:hypothetical protein
MPHNLCKSLTSPNPCNMGAWCHFPPSPNLPTLTLVAWGPGSPSSWPQSSPLPKHWWSPFQLVAWGRGSPSPWPQTSPSKHWWLAEKSVDGRWELWRGGCERSSPPSLMGSLYRNTEEVTAIYNRLVFTTRLLLWRQISLRAFSYAPSPTAPNFIWRLLRIRLEKQEGAEWK